MTLSRAWQRSLRKYWQMYLLLIPVIAYYIVFKYVPMAGVQIAFKNFKFSRGIWDSAWVGLKHFERFFASYNALTIIWNTLYLGFLTLLFCFPIPIALALLINELRARAMGIGKQNSSVRKPRYSVFQMMVKAL